MIEPITDIDRAEFDAHFRAIAELMRRKGTWRNSWRLEVDGCIFKFKVDGYPKRGTPAYEQWQRECNESA